MAESQPTSETRSQSVPLYAHAKCHDWGLAILAWERGPRRAYQFEDGRLRVFRKGYYSMLEEVDAPADRATKVIAELQRKLGNTAPLEGGKPVAEPPEPELSFDDQLRIFRSSYPDGFADDAWRKKQRGAGVARRLKRHRDGAIAEARERLGESVIDRAIAEGRASDVHTAAGEVLAGTDLVSKKQLEPLTSLPTSRHDAFAARLRDLLYGDEAFELRFERFVAMLALVRSRGPSWQLATALLALVHPEQHVCVRPATFRKQAEWMAPRLMFTATPNAPLYARFLSMTEAVADKLREAQLAPVDLMDVYDFMVATLRPSAKKLLVH